MKRPAFQFYPADWRNNAKLRRCSEGARGAWIDILCLLHDFDEYGVCRWPLADLARAANIPMRLVKELVEKNVLKGADKDAEPYIYTPRHAGKDGDPVILVSNNGGPVWYCSRFVRDEYIRQKRGQNTRFDDENNPQKNQPKVTPKSTPKGGIGEGLGDGSTSSSSSTSKTSLMDTSSSREISQGDALTPPDWYSWFNQHHGTNYSATSNHDRKTLHEVFTRWTNAGVTSGQVNQAIDRARRTAKGRIVNLPVYVDQVLISMDAESASANAASHKAQQIRVKNQQAVDRFLSQED